MSFFGAHLRIGELLIDARIVTHSQIINAVAVAEKRGLPVGRCLVLLGYVSEAILQAAIEAQSLFRDGLITLEESVVAMKIVVAEEITLEQALSDLRLKVRANATNRLGELLVEAGIVNPEEIQDYLVRSKESGLPLGRFLSSIGAVPESLIMIALNVQFLIRDRRISREEGIKNLSQAKDRHFLPRRSGRMQKPRVVPSSTNIFLGELVVKAGLVDQSTLLSIAEMALLKNQQLGLMLVREQLISEEELKIALTLQAMVAGGSVKPRRAARAMSLVRRKNLSLNRALQQAKTSEIEHGDAINLETFLGLAGIIDAREIEKLSGRDAALVFQDMINSGKASESFLRDCRQLHTLVVEGLITLDRAIIVLQHCKNTGKSARANLVELGWQLAV